MCVAWPRCFRWDKTGKIKDVLVSSQLWVHTHMNTKPEHIITAARKLDHKTLAPSEVHSLLQLFISTLASHGRSWVRQWNQTHTCKKKNCSCRFSVCFTCPENVNTLRRLSYQCWAEQESKGVGCVWSRRGLVLRLQTAAESVQLQRWRAAIRTQPTGKEGGKKDT